MVGQSPGDRDETPACLRALAPRVGLRAFRGVPFQPRPAVRDLLDAPACRFHAVPLRVVDNAPPLGDRVVIGISDPDSPLDEEPLDQILCPRPPGPRDGPLTAGRPRRGGHLRLPAVGQCGVVIHHQEPPIPRGIGRAPVTCGLWTHPAASTGARSANDHATWPMPSSNERPYPWPAHLLTAAVGENLGSMSCSGEHVGRMGYTMLRDPEKRCSKTHPRRSEVLWTASPQVRGAINGISAGQGRSVDNSMTHVPGSSASTIPGSEPPLRKGVT